ncbi:hypothetical protein ACH4A8_19985 [Streptomyces vietnamensis]
MSHRRPIFEAGMVKAPRSSAASRLHAALVARQSGVVELLLSGSGSDC